MNIKNFIILNFYFKISISTFTFSGRSININIDDKNMDEKSKCIKVEKQHDANSNSPVELEASSKEIEHQSEENKETTLSSGNDTMTIAGHPVDHNVNKCSSTHNNNPHSDEVKSSNAITTMHMSNTDSVLPSLGILPGVDNQVKQQQPDEELFVSESCSTSSNTENEKNNPKKERIIPIQIEEENESAIQTTDSAMSGEVTVAKDALSVEEEGAMAADLMATSEGAMAVDLMATSEGAVAVDLMATSEGAMASGATASEVTSPMSDSTKSDPSDVTHKVKKIKWKDIEVPIITQNNNGPCPLLAILNAMVLKVCTYILFYLLFNNLKINLSKLLLLKFPYKNSCVKFDAFLRQNNNLFFLQEGN